MIRSPRFGLQLLYRFEELAKKKGCTPGQLCLAWIMFQGEDFIPIPGTKSIKYLDENFAAKDVVVTAEDDKEIRAVLKTIQIAGERYLPEFMSGLLK